MLPRYFNILKSIMRDCWAKYDVSLEINIVVFENNRQYRNCTLR